MYAELGKWHLLWLSKLNTRELKFITTNQIKNTVGDRHINSIHHINNKKHQLIFSKLSW